MKYFVLCIFVARAVLLRVSYINLPSFVQTPTRMKKTPKQIAQHVLQLAEAGNSMESIAIFQQWTQSLPREAPQNAKWFSFTPLLEACMWLKENGGALGQAIVLRAETIPIDLRHLVLHGDIVTSTTKNSETRSTFVVDSVTPIKNYRLSCHDFYPSDKIGSEMKVMGHCDFIYLCMAWHIEVQSDGCLVFRNTNSQWKELVLRGPVRSRDVNGKNAVLGAMPLDNDAVHKWEVCGVLSSATRNDPDSMSSKFMLKCVGSQATSCFLEINSNAGSTRDINSFYVFFQERHQLSSGVLATWVIRQSNVDEARAAAKHYKDRLMECSNFNADLMEESPEILCCGFYDIVLHAELVTALARMYTLGAVTVPKLRLASDLLSSAIKLHKFYLGTCLDPTVHLNPGIVQVLEQQLQKIDATIQILG